MEKTLEIHLKEQREQIAKDIKANLINHHEEGDMPCAYCLALNEAASIARGIK